MNSIQLPAFRNHLRRSVTSVACMLLLFAATLRAQQTSGAAVGTVTDNTGAVVSGASITLTNVDTGDRRTAATNANGDYQFVNLLPGNYRIDVEASGFKHFIRTNVIVQVQGNTRVDAPLELGNVSETVEVTSQAPLVETQQATLGQMVAGRTVTELPLNGRNVFNLLALSPGVVPQGGTQASNAVSGMNGNGFSTGNYQISGGIPNTGAQFVDGGPINNGYINAIAYIPSQDSIQEFRVEGNATPRYGHKASPTGTRPSLKARRPPNRSICSFARKRSTCGTEYSSVNRARFAATTPLTNPTLPSGLSVLSSTCRA